MFANAFKKAIKVILKKPIMLWGLSLLSGLISVLAVTFCGLVPALGIAVSYVIACGMAKVYIDGLAEKQVNSDQLFEGFNSTFLRKAGGMAWKDLWLLIWTLVPVAGPIISIVKSYSYAFVPYILMTRPEIKATEAIRMSMRMTKGKKGQMFLADLCFIGGFMLATVILSLLSQIEYIGVLFAIIMVLLTIAFGLFGSIFMGLYKAAFFTGAAEINESLSAEDWRNAGFGGGSNRYAAPQSPIYGAPQNPAPVPTPAPESRLRRAPEPCTRSCTRSCACACSCARSTPESRRSFSPTDNLQQRKCTRSAARALTACSTLCLRQMRCPVCHSLSVLHQVR